LWNIVHERLPALASEAVINRHVQALYRANRDVIGTDPDLIYPGTPLVLPGGKP
jgi:nucleoid-associated protein YgaU